MSLKDTNATLFNMLTDLEEEKRPPSEENEETEHVTSLENTQMADEKTSHLTVVNPLDNLLDTQVLDTQAKATVVLGNTKTTLSDSSNYKENLKQPSLKEESVSEKHIISQDHDYQREKTLVQEDISFQSTTNKEPLDPQYEIYTNEKEEKEESSARLVQHEKQPEEVIINSILQENINEISLDNPVPASEDTSLLTLSKFMEHADDSLSQSQESLDGSLLNDLSLTTPLDSSSDSSLELSSNVPLDSLSDSSPEVSSNVSSDSSLELSSNVPLDSLSDSSLEVSSNVPLDSSSDPSPEVSSNVSLNSSSASPEISLNLSLDSSSLESERAGTSFIAPSSSLANSVELTSEESADSEEDISLSTRMILKRADQVKIAQERIRDLEDTVFAVRQENVGLSSEIEILRKRIEELSSSLDSAERRNRTKVESMSDERNLLEESLFQKNREYNNLKLKIEELKNRLAKDLKSVRVREIELENRLELVKQEKTTLLKSKDEVILSLKRKTDHLIMDIDGYRKKSQLAQMQISENEERVQRSVRALRLALGMLEGSDSQ